MVEPLQVRYLGMSNCCVIHCQTDPARYARTKCPKCGSEMTWTNGAWELAKPGIKEAVWT